MKTSALSNQKQTLLYGLIFLVLVMLFLAALAWNTTAVDWHATYYPAARAMLALHSPYIDAPLFFAPAWSLIPILPFAIFPVNVGGALFFVISLIGFAYLSYKMGCSPVGSLAFLLSAPVLNCIQTGNIEWLPLVGAFMPAPIGLIFLSMKPQSTIAIILFVLFKVMKDSGWKAVVRTIAPTVLLFVLSSLVYGFWFLRINGAFTAAGEFLFSSWPYLIPVGLTLLFFAIQRQRLDFAMAASPMLSPYAILLTWSGFVLSFAKSTRGTVLVSFLSWVVWIGYRYFYLR